ncbi:MAG: murein biosynthesis integral membrane protein MurJ [Phycisphaerales bacterium]
MSETQTNVDAGAGLGRAVRTVSGLTLVSRVMGLARDLATVRIFGDTAVGSAFAAAFAIPNMFRRLFGEGALSAAFLPEYARLDENEPESAGAFARLTLIMLALVTGAISVVIELGVLAAVLLSPADADRDLSLHLIMVMIPYMPLICIAAIMGGMLQTHERFGVWAAAPIILNVFVIGACAPFWVVEGATPAGWAYVIGVAAVAAGAVQVAWSWAALKGRVRWGAASSDSWRRVRAMLVRMVPVLIGLGTLQLNTLVDTLIAMWPVWVGPQVAGRAYPLDEASNAVLYYAQRLYQFPLGVFGVAVATAVFPALSRASDDEGRFLDTLRKGVRLSVFIALPASVGLALVREDLVGALYSGLGDGFSAGGVARAGWVVLGYSVGVWAYSLNQIWTRAFYARGDTGTPMRIAVAMVGLNLVLNLVLIWRLREAGLAWGTSIAAIVQCVLLGIAARRKLGVRADVDVRTSVMRTVLMAGAMGAFVGGLLLLWPGVESWGARAARLAVATVGGAGVFGVLALVLRAPELSWLLHPGAARPRA